MEDTEINPFPKWAEFFTDKMAPRSTHMVQYLCDALKEYRVMMSDATSAIAGRCGVARTRILLTC